MHRVQVSPGQKWAGEALDFQAFPVVTIHGDKEDRMSRFHLVSKAVRALCHPRVLGLVEGSPAVFRGWILARGGGAALILEVRPAPAEVGRTEVWRAGTVWGGEVPVKTGLTSWGIKRPRSG